MPNAAPLSAAFPPERSGGGNDQAHPPTEADAKGGTTGTQAVGGRVQRLVLSRLVKLNCKGACD